MRARWILALLIVLAAVFPYRHAVENGFAYDDVVAIEQNSRLESLSNLGEIFSTEYWNQSYLESRLYRPVTLTSFALESSLWGRDPGRLHATNLALHALTSLAVAWLILCLLVGGAAAGSPGGTAHASREERSSRLVWVAGLSGILYAVHPLHSEAVVGLVGRAEILSALFSVGVLLALLQGGRRRWFAPVLLALALLSKESSALVLYLAVALHLFGLVPMHTAQSDGRSLVSRGTAALRTLVLLAPGAIVAGGLRYWVLRDIPEPTLYFVDNPMIVLSGLERVAMASALFLRYVQLILWPDPLAPDYGYNAIPLSTPSHPPAVLGFVLILGLVVLGVAIFVRSLSNRAADRHPATVFGFGLAWYVGGTLVTGNFFFLISTLLAERLTYLPSVGFFILIAAGIAAVLETIPTAAGRQRLLLATGVLVLAVSALSIPQSQARTAAWHDNDTLFTAAVEDQPNSHRVWAELGRIRMTQGRLEEAKSMLLRSNRIYSGWSKTHDRLVSVYTDLGQVDSALVAATELRRLDPKNAKANYAFARAHQARGEWDAALAETEAGIAIQPGFLALRVAHGEILEAKGDIGAAIETYSTTMSLAPTAYAIHARLGPLLVREERWNEAAAVYRPLATVAPTWQHLNYLAWSLLHAASGEATEESRIGLLQEAATAAESAIEVAPEEMWAFPTDTLARILAGLGRRDEALVLAQQLTDRHPDEASYRELRDSLMDRPQPE